MAAGLAPAGGAEGGVHLGEEGRVGRLRQVDLLVEDLDDAARVALRLRHRVEQVEHRLVVDVLDVLELDALRRVEALLRLEGRHREVALQLLVGEVDAELLERVGLEDLEAEDVEDADEDARDAS